MGKRLHGDNVYVRSVGPGGGGLDKDKKMAEAGGELAKAKKRRNIWKKRRTVTRRRKARGKKW